MISRDDLRSVARARLDEARVLLEGKRFDGAVYLSGYSVEVALKARSPQGQDLSYAEMGWLPR